MSASEGEASVPNTSLATMVPNSSIAAGSVPTNSSFDAESLPQSLLQAKLYEALLGRVSADDLYADLTADGHKLAWKSIAALLKPVDTARYSQLHSEEAPFDVQALRDFISKLGAV
jgi:hypothetical protein